MTHHDAYQTGEHTMQPDDTPATPAERRAFFDALNKETLTVRVKLNSNTNPVLFVDIKGIELPLCATQFSGKGIRRTLDALAEKETRTYRLHPALRDDPVMVADFVRQMEARHGVPVKIEYQEEGEQVLTFPKRRTLLPENAKLQAAYEEFCYWNARGAHNTHDARVNWTQALRAGARIAHYAFHVKQPPEVHAAADALMRFHDEGETSQDEERRLVLDLVEGLERSTTSIKTPPPGTERC